MHDSECIHTGCKINLFLRVGPRLANGYHSLETFFIPLSKPHDTLHLTPVEEASGLVVECEVDGVNTRDNTLTKAYALYTRATGYAPALRVRLEKRVPLGAGLGGGSANAAGLLGYLQKNACKTGKIPLASDALQDIAKKVGADVPFFLLNAPALATGVGEQLTLTPNPFAGWHVVLVCPQIHISTPWAFAELDTARKLAQANSDEETLPEKNTNCLTTDCRQATTTFAYGMKFGNDFEKIVFKAFPSLHHLCDALREKGAHIAHLSGTGASVFGLFPDAATAQEATQHLLQAKYGLEKDRVYVQTV